jgi:hypothetical protein
MPTAAIRGRSFSPLFAKSSGKSTWKSSSVPIRQRALRSCPSDGSSSAPSHGSIAAAAWPRIGSASTERPWRSCALPQSASCSESSVKKQHDPGQTLRECGTLQVATYRGKRDISQYGDKYYLAVWCSRRWVPATIEKQRYALSVQLRHENVTTLYQTLRQPIRLKA